DSEQGYAHTHDGAPGHAHAPSSASLAGDPRARRALTLALTIGMIVLVAELIAGVVFGSLALLSDAAHIVTDVGAYAIALWAARAAMRPASASRTYGHGRIEILAALANGTTLLAASAWIIIEAIRRLIEPAQVDGAGMSIVAALGLVLNIIVLWVLWSAGSSSLNMRGAVLHAIGDLLGSVAALGAGIVITLTGYDRADPIASLLLTGLIIVSAWRLVRASADILLDTAPAGIDAEAVGSTIISVDGAIEAHDVHVWTLAPGVVSASAHVRITAGADPGGVLDAIQEQLATRLGISHSTIQMRVDRGSLPIATVSVMSVNDAIEWATDHVASAHPDLSRGVIAAAAGAAALGIAADGRVSPVQLTSRTLTTLGRRPAPPPKDQA
ncbi:MAG: cation diffusion facilitator family transporter, partial [Gaiellales bacterium]